MRHLTIIFLFFTCGLASAKSSSLEEKWRNDILEMNKDLPYKMDKINTLEKYSIDNGNYYIHMQIDTRYLLFDQFEIDKKSLIEQYCTDKEGVAWFKDGRSVITLYKDSIKKKLLRLIEISKRDCSVYGYM
jgi:hypothetical protein